MAKPTYTDSSKDTPPAQYTTERPALSVGCGPMGHTIPGNPSPCDDVKYNVPDCGNRLEEFCWYLGE